MGCEHTHTQRQHQLIGRETKMRREEKSQGTKAKGAYTLMAELKLESLRETRRVHIELERDRENKREIQRYR